MSQYGSSDAGSGQTAPGGGCPPGITWTNRIKALFAPYVQCMINQGIDLSKYNGTDGDSVVENIGAIKSEIDSGGMPRGAQYQATWKAANGTYWFDCWYQQGYPEGSVSAESESAGGGAGAAAGGAAGKAAGAQACPAGLTFTQAGDAPKSIKDLFAPYVDCMINQGIDLSKYNGTDGDSVVENIGDIQQQIDSGGMPRGAQYQQMWKADNGTFYFDCWYNAGYPE